MKRITDKGNQYFKK